VRTDPAMGSVLRAASLVAAVAWAGVLYYLSDQPSLHIPPLFPGQDKLFHAAVYAVLGVFVSGALLPAQYSGDPRRVRLAAVLVTGYGILDEFHQSFVPGRSADFFDVVADASGGLLGIVAVLYLLGRLSRAGATPG